MRILLAFLLLSFPAFADDLPPECKYLTRHVPDSDVSYKPGVDVHGKPVVSADINAAPFEVPDVIRVPLTVDLVERARDYPGQFEGLEARGDLGVIEIHSDGLVTYNGQDWSNSFYALCGYEGRGQEASDAVISPQTNETPAAAPEAPKDEERVIFGGEYRD